MPFSRFSSTRARILVGATAALALAAGGGALASNASAAGQNSKIVASGLTQDECLARAKAETHPGVSGVCEGGEYNDLGPNDYWVTIYW